MNVKQSFSALALVVFFPACSTSMPPSMSSGVSNITIDDGKRFSSSSYREPLDHSHKIHGHSRNKPPPSSYYDGLAKHNEGYYQDAFNILMPLAKKGIQEAQTLIGLMYTTGNGISQDDTKAVDWFRKAANQGDADAQSNLGYMYANGLGITMDKKEAIKLYLFAAEQGHQGAQANLAAFYSNGSASLFLDPTQRYPSNRN